jgi:hypothetical protein
MICGFNIAILVGVCMPLTRLLLNPRRSVLLGIIAVVFYTILVGASASIARAARMSSLALMPGRLGRCVHGLNTLAVGATLSTRAEDQTPRRHRGSWAGQPRGDHAPLTSSFAG